MSTTAHVDIILDGKATGLSATIRGVKGELLSFTNTLKAGFGFSIGEKVANGILGIGSAIKSNLQGATQFASQLQDLSTAAGLGVEPFQVLARSAKLSGAQMEDVSKGIVAVGEKTRDALSGPGGAADAFKVLGINVKEFADLAPERQIETLGKALATAKNPGEAFHAIMELLGAKTAPKLRAMLTELGEQGLNKLGADMAGTGLLIRDGVIKNLDAAGDLSDDTSKRFKVAWANIADSLRVPFRGIAKLSEWLADILSWVAIKLERIGIAGATVGDMISDILQGQFQGLEFYNDKANKLADEVEERAKKKKTAPLVGTEKTEGEGKILSDNKDAAYEMKQLADDVEKAQRRASLELADISRKFNLTDEQRRGATTEILQKQSDKIFGDIQRLNQLIVQLAKADPGFEKLKKDSPQLSDFQVARGLSQGPDGNKQLAGAFEQRDKMFNAQTDVQQHNADLYKDPRTAMEGASAGLTDIEKRWGSLASQIQSSVVSIGDAISNSLAGGMNQLLGTTQYWSESLGTIAGPIMGAISQSISKMFADWIVGRAAAMVKNIAASTAEGTAEATSKAPGALMSSISSFGVAAAVGVAAFLAAKALGGGFFEGGFTGLGNPHEVAGVVHKGEYVVPHGVVAAAGGPSVFEGLVRSVRNPSQMTVSPLANLGSFSGEPEKPGRPDPAERLKQPEIRIMVVDYRNHDLVDRAKADPKFKTYIRYIGRTNTGDFGSPT